VARKGILRVADGGVRRLKIQKIREVSLFFSFKHD